MSDIVISNILGFVLGILASFVSWWILFHALVPKVAFGNALCRAPTSDDASGWKYLFQFANIGRRLLIDVQIRARLAVPRPDRPGLWNVVTLALDWDGEKKLEIPKVKNKGHLAYRLFINQVPDFQQSSLYPEFVREKATRGQLSLDDLLKPPVNGKLTVYVAGFDELSGARKLFASKAYIAQDIKEGRFLALDVVPKDAPTPSAA